MMTEQRLNEIEEWIGTPESFMLMRIGSVEAQESHERRVSVALKELIAEVRWLHRVQANPALLR